MNKGQLFILSGPSGSGKDTVLKRLRELHPEVKLSISAVTRQMREGESEGEKYNFITKEKFLELLHSGRLLEHNEYLGNYYGTPKDPVDLAIAAGDDIILEIDVNGAENVLKVEPDAVTIFIMPPSLPILEQRLAGRGTEAPEVIRCRLKEAVREIRRAGEFQYIVVNGDLDDAVANLCAIFKSERSRFKRNKYIIDEVLHDVESFNW